MLKRFVIRIFRVAAGMLLALIGFGFVAGGATFAWDSLGNLDLSWNAYAMIGAPVGVIVGVVFFVVGLSLWAAAVLVAFTSDSATHIWGRRIAAD